MNPGLSPDRRVTAGRILALLTQGALALAAFHQMRALLTASAWGELHALGVFIALITALVLTGFRLSGMMKAALGSDLYRLIFGLVAAGSCVAAIGFLVPYAILVLSLLPSGLYKTPVSVSLTAGLSTLIACLGGFFLLAVYTWLSGMITILLLFRSREAWLRSWLLRGIDVPDPWRVNGSIRPLTLWETLKYRPPPVSTRSPAVMPQSPVAESPIAEPLAAEPPAAAPPVTQRPVAAPLVAEPRCDCPTDSATLSDLTHTAILSSITLPTIPGDRALAQHAQVRRCPVCTAHWWMVVSDVQHDTYERDTLPPVLLSSQIIASGTGLRCRDLAQAEALTPWYPDLRAANARFERALPSGGSATTPAQAAEVIAAHTALVALTARHPQSHHLIFSKWRTWQPSDLAVGALLPRMRELVDHLTANPADTGAQGELAALQAQCAAARATDPVVTDGSAQMIELWTSDLAPVEALQSRLYHLHAEATKAGKGSADGGQ